MRGGIILAGGKSKRFGGVDKALLDLGGGRTLLEEVAMRLVFLDELIISTSNRDRADRYSELTGIKSCIDCSPGILGGILAGSRQIDSEYVFVTAADMPLLRRDVIEHQFSLVDGFQAVVPIYPNGFIEPLHVVLERAPAIGVLRGICERGERKVSRLFDSLKTLYLPVDDFSEIDPELESFTNVNDLEKLNDLISGGSSSGCRTVG
jgi:molybdopterin-guanine dinucleotide biosynthesis protein A